MTICLRIAMILASVRRAKQRREIAMARVNRARRMIKIGRAHV
jgi:hypothetical protein